MIGRNVKMAMVRQRPAGILLLVPLICLLFVSGCQQKPAAGNSPATLRLGAIHTPLLAPLYALDDAKKGKAWEFRSFGSGGDVGYALIAGEVDAGFVETEKALQLLKAPGGEKLKIAGAIEFPYGATLVVRKDLQLRLADLAGRHLAALEPDCIITHQFKKDARRHGLNPRKIRYSYMPFAEMLPALEAKAIDGVLVKGAYGVLAELAGHKILYQNWEIKAGADDCCPPSIAQTELFLVIRPEKTEQVKPLIAALSATNTLPAAEVRGAVSRKLGYPSEALALYPLPTFATVSEALRKQLGEEQCLLVR